MWGRRQAEEAGHRTRSFLFFHPLPGTLAQSLSVLSVCQHTFLGHDLDLSSTTIIFLFSMVSVITFLCYTSKHSHLVSMGRGERAVNEEGES